MIMLCIAIGLISGLLGGFFGISGAFMVLTALTYFNMVPDQQTAAGTTLFIILPPVTILAVIYYWKHNKIDFKIASWVIGFYIIGGGLGAWGSSNFSDSQLKLAVSILFFILGIVSLITYSKLPITDTSTITPQLNFNKRLGGISSVI